MVMGNIPRRMNEKIKPGDTMPDFKVGTLYRAVPRPKISNMMNMVIVAPSINKSEMINL